MDVRKRPDSTTRPGAGAGDKNSRPGSLRLLAPRLARGILIAVLLSYVHIMTLNLLRNGLRGEVLYFSLAGVAVTSAVQFVHSTPKARLRLGGLKYLTLGFQAVFTYLPIVVHGQWWGSMAGFLAGSLLLLLRPRPAWALYGAVGVSMFVIPLLGGNAWQKSFYYCQSSLLCGIVVYGLSHLSRVIRELHDTRDELARTAVSQERLRFARDLHDLLGYSLSSITLKSELIRRLIPTQPQQAVEEVAEVLTISRQSLADVRTVASGYRDMSLEQEIASARSVLTAAEVDVRTEFRLGVVSRQVDTVLATVLREAITNLLRHSRASRCSIIVSRDHSARVRLTVLNDGACPTHRDASPDSGSGLGNLAARLQAVGGRLTFVRTDNGMFRLVAEAPAEQTAEPATAAKELATGGLGA